MITIVKIVALGFLILGSYIIFKALVEMEKDNEDN
jgi:hypothetical protein